jgi:hypothetical protein
MHTLNHKALEKSVRHNLIPLARPILLLFGAGGKLAGYSPLKASSAPPTDSASTSAIITAELKHQMHTA